jgi:Uma2 family endonuclease
VILSWLNFVIRGWLAPRGGMVLGSGLRVVVSAKHGRVPDLVVYLSDERLPPRDGLVRAPADIFVEVISKSPSDGRRDRIEKTREYAAFAVPFYWLVDPRERSLTILKLNEDKQYALVFVASDGKHEQIPGCPDLTLDLDALWAEVDRLPEE